MPSSTNLFVTALNTVSSAGSDDFASSSLTPAAKPENQQATVLLNVASAGFRQVVGVLLRDEVPVPAILQRSDVYLDDGLDVLWIHCHLLLMVSFRA
jgi:hypothetical protein